MWRLGFGLPPDALRRALGWAMLLIAQARGSFAAALGAAVLLLLVRQFNVQALANLVTVLAAEHPDMTVARPDAAVFAVSALLVVMMTATSRLLAVWSDTSMGAHLQRLLHDRLLALGGADLRPRAAQALILQNAGTAQPILRDMVAVPVTSGVAMLTAIVLLIHNLDAIRDAPAYVDAALVLMLILLPIGAMLASRHLRNAYDSYGRSLGDLAREVENSVNDPTGIAALSAQPQRARIFARRLRETSKVRLAAALRLEVTQQFQSSLPVLVQACFLIYASYGLLSAGGSHVGGVLAVFYFAPAAVRPMQTLLTTFMHVNTSWGTLSQVGKMLDAPLDPPPAFTTPAQTEGPAAVALGHVRFGFAGAGTAPVLRDLAHLFPPGSVTSIVGRAGSGKSTLLSVIAGLHLPDDGEVLIDGVASAAWRAGAARDVALVTQTPLIIADTVRENFRLARDDLDDAEIEAVCRSLGLWPILAALAPAATLDAMLSPTPGEGLSAGARRLLAVARVLLLRPRLLLLDEPTTGVDALGLDRLQACLREAARDMTVVIVEHDLDFVRRVSGTVCCLEEGRFTAIGSPAELAERPGLFRDMVRSRAALLGTDQLVVESVPLPSLDAGSLSE